MLIVLAVAILGFVAYYMMAQKKTPAKVETQKENPVQK
jgi:ABC-type transport system involved in cytochrome c biogenesis permease subunit